MKGSNNPFPSIRVVETAAGSVATPDAGDQRLYIDPTTKLLMRKNSAGASIPVAPTRTLQVIGPLTVNFDDTDVLTTGVELWTPAVGDIILGMRAEIAQSFAGSGGWATSGWTLQTDNDILMDTPADNTSGNFQLGAAGGGTDIYVGATPGGGGSNIDVGPMDVYAAFFGLKGTPYPVTTRVKVAVPIKFIIVPDAGTMTAGVVELYFTVAPVVPVP